MTALHPSEAPDRMVQGEVHGAGVACRGELQQAAQGLVSTAALLLISMARRGPFDSLRLLRALDSPVDTWVMEMVEDHERASRREVSRVARPAKTQQVEELRKRLKQAAAAILTDFRGLNVAEISQLRGKLLEAGAEYKVVKNTLLERAAESLGIRGLKQFLEGPTAVVFSRGDPIVSARALQEYIRQMRKLEVKGALVEGRVLTPDQVKALADLPSRGQLLATALGSMKFPLVGLGSVLTGLQRKLVYALDQLRRQEEAA